MGGRNLFVPRKLLQAPYRELPGTPKRARLTNTRATTKACVFATPCRRGPPGRPPGSWSAPAAPGSCWIWRFGPGEAGCWRRWTEPPAGPPRPGAGTEPATAGPTPGEEDKRMIVSNRRHEAWKTNSTRFSLPTRRSGSGNRNVSLAPIKKDRGSCGYDVCYVTKNSWWNLRTWPHLQLSHCLFISTLFFWNQVDFCTTTVWSHLCLVRQLIYHLSVGRSNCLLPSRAVVLDLTGGTEPCKVHRCISRTLRSWKNKIRFLQNISIYFLCTKWTMHQFYTTSMVKEQNMNFTQTEVKEYLLPINETFAVCCCLSDTSSEIHNKVISFSSCLSSSKRIGKKK